MPVEQHDIKTSEGLLMAVEEDLPAWRTALKLSQQAWQAVARQDWESFGKYRMIMAWDEGTGIAYDAVRLRCSSASSLKASGELVCEALDIASKRMLMNMSMALINNANNLLHAGMVEKSNTVKRHVGFYRRLWRTAGQYGLFLTPEKDGILDSGLGTLFRYDDLRAFGDAWDATAGNNAQVPSLTPEQDQAIEPVMEAYQKQWYVEHSQRVAKCWSPDAAFCSPSFH